MVHVSHSVRPSWSVYWPVGHALHWLSEERPSFLEYLPKVQRPVHSAVEERPRRLENWPAGHLVHWLSEVRPVWLENLPVEQSLHWFPAERPVWSEYLPMAHCSLQAVSTVSSLLSTPNWPAGQPWHAVDWENGKKVGSLINEPGAQQPCWALLDPTLVNALLPPAKADHAPPHKVRLKALL